MKEGLEKKIKLFLLWWLLFLTAAIIGSIVKDIFPNYLYYDIMSWSLLVGYILIVIVFLGKRYVRLSFGCIEKRWIWPAVGMSVVISVALLLALMSFFKLIDFDHLFPEATEQMTEYAQNFYSGIAAILCESIFAPIAEEIGFRGILLDGLLKTCCRPWLSILISSLAFGLLHGLVGFTGAFLFGIVIGWLYWRTRSIIPCIIIHIVNNSISFMDLSGQSNAVCLLILAVCLLSLAFCLWWFGKKCNFADKIDSTIKTLT